MAREYTAEGLIQNAWPRWARRDEGSWHRAWEIQLARPCGDTSMLASLGEGDLEIEARLDGRTLHLDTSTRENAWSDDLFFNATFRLFLRIEASLGAIDTIQGEARGRWRPFR